MPPSAPPAQSSNRSLMLVLSYLFLLALIPLLVEKDDAEVQWHAKNGLIWAVAWFALWFVLVILSNVLPVIGVVLGCLIMPVIAIGALVVHIMAMMKALKGERMRLPVLSDYADKWQ